MTYDTIDNDVTMPGGERTLLGGRLVGRDDPSAPFVDGIMAGLAKKPEDRPNKGRGVAVVLSLLAALCIGGCWFARSPSSHGIREGEEYTCPKHGDVKTLTLPGGATMEMIYVAPGSFMMGSPSSEEGRDDDETQHCVTLTKGFWLGKYEVTQEQWRSVMGSNPSEFKGDDNLPVENVSWDDCQEFVRKVNDAARRQLGGGARLPTEAEWEYACRAGTTTAYCWGNALNGDKANCDGSYPCGTTSKGPYKVQTVAVGSYQPNSWGFYDMHGNVYEWCQDRYGDYGGNATDPNGSASGVGRVLRGGCWFYYARHCRSASRSWIQPGYRSRDHGFRLCCSVGPRE